MPRRAPRRRAPQRSATGAARAGSAAVRRRRTSGPTLGAAGRASSSAIHADTRSAVARLIDSPVADARAVVALVAVLAREVALQRREHRDAQFGGVRPGTRQSATRVRLVPRRRRPRRTRVPPASPPLRPAQGRALPSARRPARRVEQADDVRRHDDLRVGQRVHQEHVARWQRGTHVEGGRHQRRNLMSCRYGATVIPWRHGVQPRSAACRSAVSGSPVSGSPPPPVLHYCGKAPPRGRRVGRRRPAPFPDSTQKLAISEP